MTLSHAGLCWCREGGVAEAVGRQHRPGSQIAKDTNTVQDLTQYSLTPACWSGFDSSYHHQLFTRGQETNQPFIFERSFGVKPTMLPEVGNWWNRSVMLKLSSATLSTDHPDGE
ncbi:hypothetical protein AMECASPLE_015148 [Ameca splendens]|uniref:Uncharacterized protein n=1 Tax=Ameca splendens TaxID=208324 RepID=A0ABV0Z0K8_9TELE